MQKILQNSYIGANIQKIRKSRGYTQEETVAGLQLLGSPIQRGVYSQIEVGNLNVFVSDLVAMQQFFNVDYSEFFKDIPTSR